MARLELNLEGLDHVLAYLSGTGSRARRGVEKGLYASGLIIMASSQEIVPVDTGALKGSGIVELPRWDGDTCVVELGYGGPAIPYAWRQHEDLTYRHKDGQQAKYLEVPLLEDEPNILGRVADAIQVEMAA